MTAAIQRERAAAGAILAAAALLAAWIMLHRPPQAPVRIVAQETAEPETPAPEPLQAAPAEPAMKFEIVELPAPAATAPLPPPTPAPRPVQTARVELPPEKVLEPQKALAPPQPAPPVVPLRPETKPPAEIVPLQVEAPVERTLSPAKPLQPLRPGDEKSTAALMPVQPLHVEPEAVVSHETKSTLAPDPGPRAPKIEAWVPKTRPRVPEVASAPELNTEPGAEPVKPPPAPAKPVADKELATEGRILLRMFEQGAGPGVEIRWPAQSAERDRLYDVFTQCLGMKVGLLDDQGHVYLGEGPRQQAMAINLDKYSGFVRRPEGAIAADEQREIARIRAYHQMSAPPARMFPRRVDAYLLGGLRAAVGDQYLKMKSIRAAYRLNGQRVTIDSIVADGRAVGGVIDLSAVASCN